MLVLGADRKFADEVASKIADLSDRPVEVMTLDDVHEDAFELTAKATRMGAKLARELSRARREAVPVSDLYLGLECGHSDATSGLTSNPLSGAIADRLVDAGATVVIGETIEWLGAEEVLRSRASDAQVGAAIVDAVRAREEGVTALGEDLLGNNPGQENIRGGLSTMEEKSLGAISKTGSRPIRSLLGFAESPAVNGLHVMDGPSFSPESMTGFVASGTQMALFTAGPGNSFCGLIAPTVKVTANPDAARRLAEQIDFDASPVFRAEETPDQAADRLFAELLDIASGSLTWRDYWRGSGVLHALGAFVVTAFDQAPAAAAKWDAVRIAGSDHVAVTVRDAEGFVTILAGNEMMRLVLASPVPMGHKFALFDMPVGTEVRKYGHVIGTLTQAAASGEHVHVHNLVSRRARAR